MLAPELVKSLKRLREFPVRYSDTHKAFVVTLADGSEAIKHGLNGALTSAFPVPFKYNETKEVKFQTLAGQQPMPPKKKARKANPHDPTPNVEVWHRHVCKTPSTTTCKEATLACHLPGVEASFGAAGFGPNFNKRHGMVVDYQLKQLVCSGFKSLLDSGMLIDPCVATLRDYFTEHQLCPIASQVPLYSGDLDIATAFDVGCTDKATRSKLHLIEVKATTGNSAEDAHYLQVRGRLRVTAARGTPLSFYVRHQLQLGVMDYMIFERLGTLPDSSRVVRVSPNCVRIYTLTPWFTEMSKKLLPVIRTKGAKQKKPKRVGFATK